MGSDRIKRIRLSLSWSQERMARELGVCVSTVNRWEMGKTSPSPRALKSIENIDILNNNDDVKC